MDEWKKPRVPPSERIEKIIDAVKESITSPGSGPEGSVGPFFSSRSFRRGGGHPRARIFGEKMAIPKRRRSK